MQNVESLKETILTLHDHIRDEVVESCEHQTLGGLSEVAAHDASDTIYAIDRVSEERIVTDLASWAAENQPVILVAEGISNDGMVLPSSASAEDAAFRVVFDPIDGTRVLMYQKRSAWILTGVAPNRGPQTSLQDIELSVMTEIPLVKQHLCDQGWAVRGQGVSWSRYNRLDGWRSDIELHPSGETSIDHGFATIFRPFPGARDVLAAVDDELARRVAGPNSVDRAICFEDQYTSTGGQLYELAAGHDRFIADLRPLVHGVQRSRGETPVMCAHPYDLCAYLVATESGVVVTGLDGGLLDAPLDTTSDVGWIGYANESIRAKIEPVLMELIRSKGLVT